MICENCLSTKFTINRKNFVTLTIEQGVILTSYKYKRFPENFFYFAIDWLENLVYPENSLAIVFFLFQTRSARR